ncbi:MAG: MBL fold metallo-hydrolase [Archangiaceae bacterium]|nr:MBL fold metallo-hydrolase [Archangiaceae bacterium]
MKTTTLFEQGGHRNLLLPDYGEGAAVQANQHLIIDSGKGVILDPGGHKVYSKVLSETFAQLGGGKLEHIFLSHQDPDIVAALNGWLMTTDATAWASQLWTRFIPHFGLDRLVTERLKGLPDFGGTLTVGSVTLQVVPAHFLHSCGNFHLYDPVSKILYSGDMGASLGQDYLEVTDFDAHLRFMEFFHRRYMASKVAMQAWAKRVRKLDIELIAPQHGALFRGKPMVERFLSWAEQLECGLDHLETLYGPP